MRIGAVDRDIGDNALISYTLDDDGDGTFNIYEDNGVISLKKKPRVSFGILS